MFCSNGCNCCNGGFFGIGIGRMPHNMPFMNGCGCGNTNNNNGDSDTGCGCGCNR